MINIEEQTHKQQVKKFENNLFFRNYSGKTIKAYKGHIRRLLNETNNPTSESTYQYLLAMSKVDNVSPSHINQAISAIKLFDKKLLTKIPARPMKRKLLPQVLSKEAIITLINSINNHKHKLMIMLAYSAGLRVGEVVRLRINDIDSDRMMIKVKQGKGRKDRYTILSKQVLNELRIHYKATRPKYWLFVGANGYKHISERTLQSVFTRAKEKTKINQSATFHWLRHSFATHLLEEGTDIRYIQELLGHTSTKTTQIYTHVANRNIKNITSPFDTMDSIKD